MAGASRQALLKGLQGSESRDVFKRIHRDHGKARPWFYACDIDFCLVAKEPQPHIVAVIDYKEPGDDISFTEVIVYNRLIRRGLPVFIVEGQTSITDTEKDDQSFDILQYQWGNLYSRPAEAFTKTVETGIGWDAFFDWEQEIRDFREEKMS